MAPAREDTAEQNGGIDGGDFGIPNSFPGFDIGEVIEEATMVRHDVPKRSQRLDDTLTRIGERYVAALLTNAKCGKTESGSGNAGDGTVVGRANVAAILDQAGVGAGLIPEELEIRLLQVFQKLVILGRKVKRREFG
jgi:hypothetical protein